MAARSVSYLGRSCWVSAEGCSRRGQSVATQRLLPHIAPERDIERGGRRQQKMDYLKKIRKNRRGVRMRCCMFLTPLECIPLESTVRIL